MNTTKAGHCPSCSQEVAFPFLRPSGVWHGVDVAGEPVGGDLFEVRCPSCGTGLVAYEEAGGLPECGDPGQLSWQASEAGAA
jgi:hypothetical protein